MEKSKNTHTEHEPREKVNISAVVIFVGIMLLMMVAIGWALMR